jgi:hypothetical protein
MREDFFEPRGDDFLLIARVAALAVTERICVVS